MMSERHFNHNYFSQICKIERDTFVLLGPFLSNQNGAIKGISVKLRSETGPDGRTNKHASKLGGTYTIGPSGYCRFFSQEFDERLIAKSQKPPDERLNLNSNPYVKSDQM